MPGYKTHLGAGFVTFILLGHWGPPITHFANLSHHAIFAALLLSLFGSIFPDIDTKSIAQLLFYKIILIIAFLSILYQQTEYLTLIIPLSILPLLVHHRTLTHRPLFFCTLSLCCTFIFATITKKTFVSVTPGCIYFSASALSHILLDFRKRAFLKKNRSMKIK